MKKRIYKYSEKEYELTLSIKAQDGKKSEWQKFPISQKEFIDYTMQEMIDLPPNCEEEKKKGIY